MMEETKPAESMIDEFIPSLETPGRNWYIKTSILLLVIVIGLYAFYRQIVDGHIITGMRDNVVWGVYIVNFIFFLGLSYAGSLVSCIFHLARIEWGRPLIRMLEIMAVVSLIIAPIFILLCIGRVDRLFNLFIHARIQSPITWDVIAIVTDLIFCFTYLYLTHIKDFAKLRDYQNLNVSGWRKKAYGYLSLGYTGTEDQKKHLNYAQDILAAIIIPTSIVAYSLLAWLFGMNLRPGWHSSIFAPYFVLTAVYSGVAMLIVVMWMYRKWFHLEKYITKEHFSYLGFAMFILALFYGYFAFSDYITEWYNPEKSNSSLLAKYFDLKEYGLMSFFANFTTALLPVIIVGIPFFRSIRSISITAGIVLLGIWFKRYLLIVPSLETPYIPIQDIRQAWVNYSATWVEWALTAAGIAFLVLVYVLMSKLVPIIPIAEMEEKDHQKIKVAKF